MKRGEPAPTAEPPKPPKQRVKITERGDRGFHQYGYTSRCTYGSEVEVYESSAATAPHVWLKIDSSAWVTKDRSPEDFAVGTAHLTEDQARYLIARLQAWVDEIPTRWGR